MTSVLAFPLEPQLSQLTPGLGEVASTLNSHQLSVPLTSSPKLAAMFYISRGRRIPLMLPWLGETSALFTLVAAQRPLKASPLPPQPTVGGAAVHGAGPAPPDPSTPTWPLVIQQGRGHSHHQGMAEVLGSSKEGGFLKARSASLRGEFVLSLAEDDQADWK